MWNEFAHALIALANNYFDRIVMTRAIFGAAVLCECYIKSGKMYLVFV